MLTVYYRDGAAACGAGGDQGAGEELPEARPGVGPGGRQQARHGVPEKVCCISLL